MKLFKKVLYFAGAIILLMVIAYGYSAYRKHDVKKQLEMAKTSYEKGDKAAAIAVLENLYNKMPNSSEGKEAIYFLAKCYLDVNELEKSENYWNKLLTEDSKTYGAECLFNLACIEKLKGNSDNAIKSYEQLIKDYPQSDLVDDAKLNLGIIYKEKGQFVEAKDKLNDILENNPESNLIDEVGKELGNVNIAILFSPTISEGTTEYTVKEGDSLFIIAQSFGTTVELIKKCNNLKSDFIKPGERLKIITAKFSIIVDKSRNILTLKSGEKVVKVYSVGTGTEGCTPVGTYIINNKIVNPPWHKPGAGVIPFGDKNNVLGTRWMGLNIAGYGIHGTWEPETIGKQASAGCVRMLNDEIEELFQIVPVGTEVTVIE